MYKYLRDNVFLKQMGRDCNGHLKSLQKLINKDNKLRVTFKLVGNDPLTMTVQEGNNPIEIPFILFIDNILDSTLSEEDIKKYIMEQFNKIEGSAFGNCIDSRFGIETKYIWYTTGNNTKFKLNISLLIKKDNKFYRLLKSKKGTAYSIEPLENSSNFLSNEIKIREQNLNERLKINYLNKINFNFKNNNLVNYSLLDCYIDALIYTLKK